LTVTDSLAPTISCQTLQFLRVLAARARQRSPLTSPRQMTVELPVILRAWLPLAATISRAQPTR
jgi:hypothetical protein